MKIYSWNVNGLRAVHRKGNWDWFVKTKPDILCVQETKSRPEQLSDDLREPEGYFSYFAYPKHKKGYSGVATYSKIEPKKVSYGMGIEKFDDEGRVLTAFYDGFVLVNAYMPNGGMSADRLKFKMEFYDAFLLYIEKLKKKHKNVIFCGDVNTAHNEIDLARPKQNEKNTGFLPEEREWIDEVLSSGYIDTFRHLHPNKKEAYSYWDMKTRARDRNVGWRIDYFFVSNSLQKKIKKATIHTKVFGSDHCPISIEVVI